MAKWLPHSHSGVKQTVFLEKKDELNSEIKKYLYEITLWCIHQYIYIYTYIYTYIYYTV